MRVLRIGTIRVGADDAVGEMDQTRPLLSVLKSLRLRVRNSPLFVPQEIAELCHTGNALTEFCFEVPTNR